jgi:hypothetical protein
MRLLPLMLLGLLLAGCGSPATPEGLPPLAEQLRSDGEAVMADMADSFGKQGQEVEQDASQDQECESEGVKRVFSASGEATSGGDPDLGLVETTLAGWFRERGYEIERFPTNDTGARRYIFGKQRLEFEASVESGPATAYEIVGQTPCLS